LSFSEQEGFGLPPAEAMACGCYVVGFTGLAGREFFDPATCAPVAEGDVLAFARQVEQAMRSYEEDPDGIRQRALAASARIRREYAPDRLRADLVTFFEPLLADGVATAGAREA
jgi:glycosyltransferase involved in cell wall biosynthesis